MCRNMCKMRHKVRNGHFYPIKVQISSILKKFQIKVLIWNFDFQKQIASIRL